MKKNVAVFFGGVTTEHEVSIESAKNVIKNLNENKFYEIYPIFIDRNGDWFLTNLNIWEGINKISNVFFDFSKKTFIFDNNKKNIDVCFSLIHGNIGEDGKLAGFFETVGLAYTGCGVLSSAIGMNKKLSKMLVKSAGVEVLDDIFVNRKDFKKEEVLRYVNNTGFPVFVKPNTLGSSVGVSKVKNIDEIFAAINKAFNYDNEILIEKGIDRARELVVGIIGDGFKNHVSEVGEVIVKGRHEFYDYEAKYLDDNGMELKIPANVDSSIADILKKETEKIFRAVGGYGFSRIDFLMDPKTEDFFFCEINTIPGFTSHSLFPRLFELTGIEVKKQLEMIIELAIRRKKENDSLKRMI